MKYGRAIRVVRIARGMSKKELAERVGIDNSYVSLIEQGRRVPSVAKVEAIAGVLRAPVHILALLAAEKAQLESLSSQEFVLIGRFILGLLAESSKRFDDFCG